MPSLLGAYPGLPIRVPGLSICRGPQVLPSPSPAQPRSVNPHSSRYTAQLHPSDHAGAFAVSGQPIRSTHVISPRPAPPAVDLVGGGAAVGPCRQ